MGRYRLYAAVGYLVLGMWLGSSSFNGATALSPSLTFPLKLTQRQPRSNTPDPDTDSSAGAFKSSISLQPISPACPFPSIPVSPAAAKVLFGFEFTTSFVVSEASSSPTFVRGDGSDSDLYWTVHNLISARKLDQALQVAQKIKDVSQKNEALRSIADAYKDAGQLTQALEVAKSMTEPSHQTDTGLDDNISVKDNALNDIAEAYMKAGQLEQALQVAESMGDAFKFTTLLSIADKYRAVNQSERAAEVIDRAVAAYRIAKHIFTDLDYPAYFKMILLNRIASQYIAVGRKEQAVELSSEIFEAAKTLPVQNYITLSVLSSAAGMYALAGQKDKAAEVLSYSLQAAKDIKETFVKALLFTNIADEYVVLKQPERTTELLSQALELAKSEKEVSKKNIVLIELAHTYGMLGQYEKAFQVINAVEPASLRDQVKQALSCSQKPDR